MKHTGSYGFKQQKRGIRGDAELRGDFSGRKHRLQITLRPSGLGLVARAQQLQKRTLCKINPLHAGKPRRREIRDCFVQYHAIRLIQHIKQQHGSANCKCEPLRSRFARGNQFLPKHDAGRIDFEIELPLSGYTLEEGRQKEIDAMRKSIKYMHEVLDIGIRGR